VQAGVHEPARAERERDGQHEGDDNFHINSPFTRGCSPLLDE
jgi:hypothetical protein